MREEGHEQTLRILVHPRQRIQSGFHMLRRVACGMWHRRERTREMDYYGVRCEASASEASVSEASVSEASSINPSFCGGRRVQTIVIIPGSPLAIALPILRSVRRGNASRLNESSPCVGCRPSVPRVVRQGNLTVDWCPWSWIRTMHNCINFHREACFKCSQFAAR